jgi:diphthamide synthase (EF-2-diphthine--ammonia ligase)
MDRFLRIWMKKGATHCSFGDLHLEDVRRYRNEKLAQLGVEPVFPIWGEDTRRLAHEMLEVGFRDDLPPDVDPCGENGEFHIFVYDGPIFTERIQVKVGELVLRDGFQFADIDAKAAKR